MVAEIFSANLQGTGSGSHPWGFLFASKVNYRRYHKRKLEKEGRNSAARKQHEETRLLRADGRQFK